MNVWLFAAEELKIARCPHSGPAAGSNAPICSLDWLD